MTITVAGLASVAIVLARPRLFATGLEPAAGGWSPAGGPAFEIASLLFLATLVFGLVASISAYRGARDPAARARARAWVLAFGVRDSLLLVFFATVVLLASRAIAPGSPWEIVVPVSSDLASLAFVLLASYGVLHDQLFDIDLKIKAGIRGGTIAGVLVAVFFVGEKVAEAFLNQRFGWLLGAVLAGLLLFAAPRLTELGNAVARSALPKADGSVEYVAFRKLEVYKAAVESALEEGEITERERRALTRLAGKLGIAPEAASRIETDVMADATATG